MASISAGATLSFSSMNLHRLSPTAVQQGIIETATLPLDVMGYLEDDAQGFLWVRRSGLQVVEGLLERIQVLLGPLEKFASHGGDDGLGPFQDLIVHPARHSGLDLVLEGIGRRDDFNLRIIAHRNRFPPRGVPGDGCRPRDSHQEITEW